MSDEIKTRKVVERVARAICNEDDGPGGGQPDRVFSAAHDGDCTGQPHKCLACEAVWYRDLARAAIAAIREPAIAEEPDFGPS